ncbi:MAG: hypothetical protein H0V56_07725 [Chthoniobacterales bacterium]|nr:hypothetical protein [Chthoniobacterales bacterium]
MKQIWTRSGICVAVFAVFLGTAALSQAKGTKSINGTFSGQATVTPISLQPPVFRQNNVATGTISHLGRVTAEWTVREVSFASQGTQLVIAQPDWIGVIKAQNGDQIIGAYTFRSSTLPISPDGEVQFIADLNITGGTGRFAGATGQAVSIGRGNIWTGRFTLDLTGSITLR